MVKIPVLRLTTTFILLCVVAIGSSFWPDFPKVQLTLEGFDGLQPKAGERTEILRVRDMTGRETKLFIAFWDAKEGDDQFKSWSSPRPRTLTIAVDQKLTLSGPLASAMSNVWGLKFGYQENVPFNKIESVNYDKMKSVNSVFLVAISTDLSSDDTPGGRCRPGDHECNRIALTRGLIRIRDEMWRSDNGNGTWLLPRLLTGYQELKPVYFYEELRCFLSKAFGDENGSRLPAEIDLMLYSCLNDPTRQMNFLREMAIQLERELYRSFPKTTRGDMMPRTLGVVVALMSALLLSWIFEHRRIASQKHPSASSYTPLWRCPELLLTMTVWLVGSFCFASAVSIYIDRVFGASFTGTGVEAALGFVGVLGILFAKRGEKILQKRATRILGNRTTEVS